MTWLAFAQTLPGCAFHRMTGLLCPFCGMTHAARSLCSGDLEESIAFNPMLVPTLFVLAASIVSAGKGWIRCVGQLLVIGFVVSFIVRNPPAKHERNRFC